MIKKDTKQEKSQDDERMLMNWNASDGSPYGDEVSEDNDRDALYEWKIVDKKEDLQTVIEEYRFFNHIKTMATLNYNQSDLLGSGEYIDEYIDKKLPIIVDLTYPFSKVVRVKIQPMSQMIGKDTMYNANLGTIIWQISRAYADLYRNHWEEIGVWGHGFGDLYLEILRICKGNVFKVYVGS